MYCPFCGVGLDNSPKLCSSCGRDIGFIIEAASTVYAGTDACFIPAKSAVHHFMRYIKLTETERKTCSKPKKKTVKISVGMMHKTKHGFKAIRGNTLPLQVEPQWSSEKLLAVAWKKFKYFYQERKDGECVLLYPDGSQVKHIPGTETPFTIEKYKGAIGKAYQRITLYICTLEDLSKPAYEMQTSDPDWMPSLHIGSSEGNIRCTERLLHSVQSDKDQNGRRSVETRPPHETETAGGPEQPAVRPWREVKSLLQSALQHESNFSKQPGDKTQERPAVAKKLDLDIRNFFRNALEASLEAASRSRTRQVSPSEEGNMELDLELPAVKKNQTCESSSSSSSSSCENCVRLQGRNMELEEKLLYLTGQQEASPVFSKAPLQPDQDLQRPETDHVEVEDPTWLQRSSLDRRLTTLFD